MNDPLFAGVALAERIERAETRHIAGATEAASLRTGRPVVVLEVAGGAACIADPGSPMNKVVGLGFGGVPSDAELTEIERLYAAHDTPVQVELSNLGDPEIGAVLTGRGYRLVSFENVLGRALDDVTPAPDSAHPDTAGVPSHEDFPREVVENAERDTVASGAAAYLAYLDGEVAGAAALQMRDGIAQLVGAATLPAHRRRGVQAALVATRLADAVAAGCDVAVVTTQPGSTSQHNTQRRGFHLLYTRAILVK
ncbi:GNAT family acetyltransferase [Mycolicibacterium phlei]|uniref:GNAT family acetyltransferase n=1 Tax=Mycolicibacterium phlei DSM 43239 = CCUG 21000 TaxID=1226750 RepID=A0A5N5VD64_MYCPH|nr:GNAT family N-acetyltransferase [Mycolicibacterium phlei]VEG11329.1 GNAT family acetyltransferase [Mycobacteroides chelonae]AMO63232.1 Acetyltransferase (GNAT) family protein [Mycolicibacterium phlei]KAB7759902.1 GNAT family acetyltransferase [Mycolicibacterium phlei DSM 43239 = CCUG 21000]KXW64269.1 GNAT family acetyltransferase [Mycolicibacterium phlei DSM 43072]KXW68949.1 GNAT family acetyltransferase [Mycolicibacterium phlei DSM 43239 = CCUG 21000]